MTTPLRSLTATSGFELPAGAMERLERFRDLLAEASRSFNLTAVRDPEQIERRHIVESIVLARLLQERGLLTAGSRVLDLGSGAGLPGLPVKVVFPQCEMFLLDAHGKRCAFLRQTIAELGLSGAGVLEGRAEDLGHDPDLRQSFDLALARAVAPLPVLLEYALPFLRIEGNMAVTKGSALVSELPQSERALAELGGELVEVLPFHPPEGLAQSLVVVRKVRETPQRYPRRPGVPSKRPLA